MLEKLDERHKEWLISNEEIEIETSIAEGIGQWSDPDQRLLELAAMRLDFSAGFDYDLTAIGSQSSQ